MLALMVVLGLYDPDFTSSQPIKENKPSTLVSELWFRRAII